MKQLPLIAIAASAFLISGCKSDMGMAAGDLQPSSTWYVDADGDGYGDENDAGSVSTVQPSGYVDNNTDCDDTQDTINPNATESNDDQVDSDCDGALSKAPFIIGDIGPAGGIVFQTDGTNGLEAAPNDQDDGTGAEWGCYGIAITGADSTTDGAQNTADMLAAACSPGTGGNPLAVDLVAAYSLNGYDDWYLPAKDELNTLYAQEDTVGGFASQGYWSSSEGSQNNAWNQYFGIGIQSNEYKVYQFRVRAVRAF